jgi:hypothetical protein
MDTNQLREDYKIKGEYFFSPSEGKKHGKKDE